MRGGTSWLAAAPPHLGVQDREEVLGGDLHSPLIYLRDHAGEKIDFNSGIPTVLLHFREKL